MAAQLVPPRVQNVAPSLEVSPDGHAVHGGKPSELKAPPGQFPERAPRVGEHQYEVQALTRL